MKVELIICAVGVGVGRYLGKGAGGCFSSVDVYAASIVQYIHVFFFFVVSGVGVGYT